MKVTKMNSAKKNSIKTILSRALVVLLSYAMISSTSPAGYVAAYGLDETTDVAAEQAATTEETQATEAAPAETPAPAEEPAQAAPAQTETTIALNLGNGYITYYGQTIAAPTSSLSVPTDRDFTFAAAANGGYTLKAVYRTMGESETPIAANADGTYTLAASDFAAGVGIRIETEGAASEGAAATSLTSAQDALDQVLADSTETVYTYEDQYVSVTATLSDPHAVPDGADFVVTQVTPDTKDADGNPAYNYDAYMDALNGGETTDDSTYTADNTLLYDIAFMYPELGEDGQPTGKTVEFEPADGTVKIEIQYKQNQLSDALGVAEDTTNDVEVDHLVLTDEVKEGIDTTADATNVDADDIKVKSTTDQTVNVDGQQMTSFTTDSFSVFAIKRNKAQANSWTGTTDATIANIVRNLGTSNQFAVVANTLEATEHIEGNIRVGELKLTGNTQLNNGGRVYKLNKLTGINVTKTVDGPDGTFKFAFYDTDNNMVGNAFEITTQDGQGTISLKRGENGYDDIFSALDGGKLLKIYELDSKGKPVSEGQKNGDYTVSYNYKSGQGIEISGIANTPLDNFIGQFTSANGGRVEGSYTQFFGDRPANTYVGETFTEGDGTNGHNRDYVYFGTDEDFVVQNTKASRFTYVEGLAATISGEIDTRASYSSTLASAKNGTTDADNGVNVINVTSTTGNLTSDLDAANFANDANSQSYYLTGLRAKNQYVLINIDATGYGTYTLSNPNPFFDGINPQNAYNYLASHVIYNLVQRDDSGAYVPYTGTVVFGSHVSGAIIAPRATVDQTGAMLEGSIIANYVKHSGQEIHKTPIAEGTEYDIDVAVHNTGEHHEEKGSLKVTKTIEGNLSAADLTDAQKRAIVFTVTGPNNYSSTFTYADMKNGEETLSELAPGDYTVTETVGGVTGYIVSTTVTNDGKATVVANQTAQVDITNTYTKKTGKAQFGGTKIYEGQLTGNFGFTATLVKVDDKKVEESNDTTYHATVDGAGTFTFPEITYDKTGTYTYEVTEDNGGQTLGGIVYDGHSYNVTVEVTEGADGLVTKVSGADKVTFTNTDYTATGHVTFEGKKSISGRDMTDDDIYTFVVSENGTNNSWTVQNEADGTIKYPTIDYTLKDVGEHTYTVTETAGSDSSIAYDKTSYTVTVTVKDETKDGKLEITTSDNAKSLNFTNTYSATGSLTLSGRKTLENQGINANNAQLFTYEVLEVNKDGKTIKTVQRPVATNADGSIAFQPISYTLADKGTHYYIVREIIPEGSERVGDTNTWKSGSYIYDGTNYRFTVEVSDNGDGTLSVRKSGDNPEALNFTNTYKASGSVVLMASKVLVGREMNQGEFTFKLKDAQGNVLQTVTNDANSNNGVHGSVTFAEITYTKADLEKAVHDRTATKNEDGSYTVTYTIEEVAGTDEHITYANNTVNVTVTIVDNGNGKLIANPSYPNGNKFKNTYSAEGSVTFKGEKSMKGRALTDYDVFSFTIQETSDWVAEAHLYHDTVTNSGSTINYPTIKYTLADVGLHTYTITETVPTTAQDQGVAAKTSTRTVKVNVVDNGDGTLTAEKVEGFDYEAADFENTYSAQGELTLSGKKTLKNKDLNANTASLFTYTAVEAKDGRATDRTFAGTTDDEGNITFPKIRYTLEDAGHTFTYTVTEVVPAQAKNADGVAYADATDAQRAAGGFKLNGITYDAKSYTVTTRVTDNGDGTLRVEKSGDDSARLNFTNTYTATNSLTLGGTKTLENKGLNEENAKLFTYTVVENENGVPTGRTFTGTTDKYGKITFQSIDYALANAGHTYTYTVTENNHGQKIDGIKYSDKTYSFTVAVTDNGDGTLTLTKSGDNPEALDFTNTYTATGKVQFEGTKTMEGRSLADTDVFEFTISENNEVVATANNTGKTINYPAINYSLADVGEHTYTVAETEHNVAGVKTDTNTYTVTVNVSDNGDGTLKVEKSGNYQQLNFTNTYTTSAYVEISGSKEISGRKFADGESYTFTIEGSAGAPMPTNTSVIIKPTRGTFSSPFSFGTIDYTQADAGKTYTYTVRESNGGETVKGVTYDDAVKTVTVQVTDDGRGNLKAEVVNSESNKLVFKNEYHTQSTSVSFGGTKTLNGRKLKAGEFTFQLVEDGRQLQTVKNGDHGSFSFEDITYTKPGTHNYTVSEVIPNEATNADGVPYAEATAKQKAAGGFKLNGVTYTNASYSIQVKVTDDGQGNLVKTVTGVDDPTQLSFTNDYAASGELELAGTKSMDGRDLTNDDVFSFTIDETTETVAEVDRYHRTVINSGATINYPTISYTLKDVGEHTYTVAEVAYNAAGVKSSKKTYTFTVKVSDNGDGTLKVEKSGDDPTQLNFKNTYSAKGQLDLSGVKTLENLELNETTAQLFTYTVRDVNGKTVSTGTTDERGNITFGPIKYTLADARQTYTYTVTEDVPAQAKNADGVAYEDATAEQRASGGFKLNGITYDKTVHTVKVEVSDANHNGVLTVTPTSDSDNTTGMNFTNTYKATGKVTFHGTKTYGGDKTGFTFTAVEQENGQATGRTFHGTTDKDGKITFDTVKYTLANVGHTYTYIVTEDIPGQAKNADGTTYAYASEDKRAAGGFVYEGITYDSTPQTVTVEVKDDVKDGKLEVTPSANAQSLAFTNTYGAKGSIALEGTKTLTGRDMDAGEFTFQVKEGDAVVATGANVAAANGQAGVINFSTINYTEAGEHDYTVSEVTPTLGGVTAGGESYDVHVKVTDNGDGTLKAERTDNVGNLAFTNTYGAKGSITLEGTKALTGRTMNAGEFEFQVTENGVVVATGKNDADGRITFSAISYTEAGEHDYTVSEVAPSQGGVTAGGESYDIHVKVTDNGDGTLKAERTDNIAEIAFTNTYTAAGQVTLTGTKTLTGRDMAEGEFGFTVTDNATNKVVATGSNAAAANGQAGVITFEPITYTQANMVDADGNFVSEKDFTYTVRENAGDKGGVAYSTQSFKATVHVVDNGDGTLTAEVVDSKSDEVAFTNTYTHEDTEVTFGGHKYVENKNPENADKVFTFQLVETDADGNALEGTKPQTVTRTGAGDYSFAPISYTEAGIHYYKVTEIKGDAAGYSYDTTVYTETVTVTDNGNGNLVAEVTGTSTVANALNFTNTYKVEATDTTLSAVKNLTGRAWADGDTFNFELKTTNGAPMPADAGAIATAAGADHKATFGSIHYTQAGEYTYTISELAPTAEGAVKNDDGTYTLNGVTYNPNAVSVVTVTVTDNDGQLVADVKYDGKTDLPVFTNTYQAGKTTASLEAVKALNGGDIADFDGKFNFTLTAGENDANVATPMPTAAGDADTLTVTNAGTAVTFGEIEYATAGTYNYTITEVQGDQGGVTYDKTEHTAKVVVTDDHNGALHATVTYDDVEPTEDTPSPAPVFNNTYFAAKASISADKHFYGAGDGTFNFTLVKTDSSWNAIDDGTGTFANYGAGDAVVDEGQPFQITVSNGAYENDVAKVQFPEITYYEAGTYYYKLAETSEDATDASLYLITVTVDENQQATIAYKAVRDGQEIADATDTDAAAFYNNGYVAAAGRAMRLRAMRNAEHSVNVMPVVQKELDGATLEAGEFTFLLTGEDGTSVTATNDADGTVAFAQKTADGVDVKSDENGVLTFTKPGTYTYTISEVKGEDQLIKYDDSEVTLTVTVKADAKGKLTATTSYEGGTKTTDDGTPVFVNEQKAITLRTRKTSKVTGDPLPGATYGLWMVNEGGEDVYLGNAVSDENGYIEFTDFKPEEGAKYYFKEEAAPAGHLVNPYRDVYMMFERTNEGYKTLYEGEDF